MRRLTYTNARGESIVLGDSPPFVVTKLEGTGGVDTDIKTQKSPYQDGATYLDTYLEMRQLTLEGCILARSRQQLFDLRRELARVFNPKFGPGKLLYEYDGGQKEIQAVVDGSPVFPERRGGIMAQNFLITLLCPDPFWLDTYYVSKQMSYLMGGIQFPLQLPTIFAQRTHYRSVINSGDVSTPVTIEFYGPAVNPVVTNETTGEFIKVRQTLEDGDVLHIDTAFGRKRVEIEKADGTRYNAFHFIDLSSTFFQLEPGDNVLSYSSDDDSTTARVIVKYRNRYVGV
ncbi:MAG: phage tail protein [Bacillus thermozeamaize]|uniref:Phage tail protein n=1 Tax=Bacillus thermozeamaize TaxID=230954 RepID=A0A1Y3PEV5_9BACI|nr:MAG: phage tail protein [Bacillus thermozeamaize]